MTSLVRTADAELRERFDLWRHAVSDAFVPLTATTDEPDGFVGQLRSGELGSIKVCEVTAQGHLVQRTPKLIRQTDPDFFKLGLQVRGYCVLTQDGREAALTPGDFAIYSTTRPYQLAFDNEFRMLVVMFPRALLRVREQDMRRLTAVRISGRQGMGSLVSPFLANLGKQMDEIGHSGSLRLSDTVLDLLAATFSEQVGDEPVAGHDGRRVLIMRIKAFIEERLDDPELSPPGIAAANHISTRYLQKLFEAEGETVAGWIRERRLERCRRDLTDPSLVERPVSAVGARWGILDAAHFSRLFRGTYGMAPREYRIAHLGDGTTIARAVPLPGTEPE
ncbi:MAG: helix-turn-helix domain-containing protein [Haloechinothrix sp.]